VQLLIDHFGSESVDNITKHSIIALQEKLVENGRPRPYIDRYIGLIKAIFAEGEYRGWGVSEKTADSISRVRNLKKGRTRAPEYADVDAIDDSIIEKTLPFMNDTIRAMVQIQRICCMRGQDVRNLRLHDIDTDSYEVWIYCHFNPSAA
jgi:integrase